MVWGDPKQEDLFKWKTGVIDKEGDAVCICVAPKERAEGSNAVCIHTGSCRVCPEVIGAPALPIEFGAFYSSS